jgi:hypothetical protein
MSLLEKWLAEVESWVGTPYFTEGCTKGVKGGANCGSWLVDAMCNVFPNSESIEYARGITHVSYFKKNIDVMPEVMEHLCFSITLKEIQPGDVVFPRIRRVAAIPSVYFGNDEFVYCDTSQRLIVKRALLGNLVERIAYVYRFRALAEEV